MYLQVMLTKSARFTSTSAMSRVNRFECPEVIGTDVHFDRFLHLVKE